MLWGNQRGGSTKTSVVLPNADEMIHMNGAIISSAPIPRIRMVKIFPHGIGLRGLSSAADCAVSCDCVATVLSFISRTPSGG